MKRYFHLISCAFVLTVSAASSAGASSSEKARPTAAPSESCEEQCLRAISERYLQAMAKRDKALIPLAAGARYSENGVPLAFGDGLWRTFERPSGYRNIFTDASQGQVAMFATIVENGSEQLMMLRLKVASGKISEAESFVVRRQGSAFLNTEGLVLDPVWGKALAPDDKPTRAQLIAAIDPYFDALSKGDGSLAPFHPDCVRIENGITTAGVEGATRRIGKMPFGPPRLLARCASQADSGRFTYIQDIDPRRYLIVDERRGLVFGIFHFQHPGDKLIARSKDGHEEPMGPHATTPSTVPVAELFKVERGKIVAIEAVMVTTPYRMPSAW